MGLAIPSTPGDREGDSTLVAPARSRPLGPIPRHQVTKTTLTDRVCVCVIVHKQDCERVNVTLGGALRKGHSALVEIGYHGEETLACST